MARASEAFFWHDNDKDLVTCFSLVQHSEPFCLGVLTMIEAPLQAPGTFSISAVHVGLAEAWLSLLITTTHSKLGNGHLS